MLMQALPFFIAWEQCRHLGSALCTSCLEFATAAGFGEVKQGTRQPQATGGAASLFARHPELSSQIFHIENTGLEERQE